MPVVIVHLPLPCSEPNVRDKVPPASSSSSFLELSHFTVSMGLNSWFRSFLGHRDHFPPSSLPRIAIFQCLNTKSWRGSFATPLHSAIFPEVLRLFLNILISFPYSTYPVVGLLNHVVVHFSYNFRNLHTVSHHGCTDLHSHSVKQLHSCTCSPVYVCYL